MQIYLFICDGCGVVKPHVHLHEKGREAIVYSKEAMLRLGPNSLAQINGLDLPQVLQQEDIASFIKMGWQDCLSIQAYLRRRH